MTPYQLTLKALRKLYAKTGRAFKTPVAPRECDIDSCRDIIFNTLSAGAPCMMARFGGFELSCVCNYLSIQRARTQGRMARARDYIRGYGAEFWWTRNETR